MTAKNPVPNPLPLCCGLLLLGAVSPAFGQGESLKTDLVAYWPLDVIQGTKTPDLKNGYDMNLQGLTAADLIQGRRGNAFHFTSSRATYLHRTHVAGEELPMSQHKSFTVAFWTRTDYTGQNDLRLFSEGSSTNNNPLFNLGTHNTGANASVDVFIRAPGTFNVNHLHSVGLPLDGADWHHIAFVQTLIANDVSTRQLYIDGVLDPLSITSRAAGEVYLLNNTSIGGILRASASAFVTGDIDDVAIWKRGLTAAEIVDLRDNGIPDLTPPPEPLQINAFTADFRNTAAGDTVRLRWDATKDATLSISPDVGDVTASSAFGVGQTDVTVTAPATYTLTAARGAEPPVTRTVSVGTVPAVASGWHWVEDFENLNPGPVGGQASWLAADGIFNVIAQGSTQGLATSAGNDLTAVDLKSWTVLENSAATLFFRFCYSSAEPDTEISISTGLTEKSIRGPGDFTSNVGTYVTLRRIAGGPLTLQAVNGIGGIPEDAPFEFEPDQVYNVWLDVTNDELGFSDLFSVHVAREGSGSRTTVFDGFVSDRSPEEVLVLGFPKPDINFVFATAPNIVQASQAIVLDDYYISPGPGFRSTVPVPSSFGKALPPDFLITDIDYETATGLVTLTWASLPGETYSVWSSADLATWTAVNNSVPSQGASTTATLTTPFRNPRTYFQVRK